MARKVHLAPSGKELLSEKTLLTFERVGESVFKVYNF